MENNNRIIAPHDAIDEILRRKISDGLSSGVQHFNQHGSPLLTVEAVLEELEKCRPVITIDPPEQGKSGNVLERVREVKQGPLMIPWPIKC